jgi:UDP-glucose 4-epimerase
MNEEPISVHDDGQQERCFAHVKDVVGAITTLMAKPETYGRIYNIGSDQPFSILAMAQRVKDILQSPSSIVFQTYSDAYDADFEDIRRRVPDLTRIKQAIGYQPSCGLDQIILDVWESMKS